jgi:hypothetical protein
MSNTAYEAVRKDVFVVIPLFVLMGDFIWRSGAAGDLYRICDRSLRRLPGRLAIATIAGNTVFAAVTGVSIASAAAFSRIAYPEMMKLGYKQTFALGAVAGSACFDLEFRSGEYGRVEILDSERMRDHERCRHRVLCFTRILSCIYLNRLQLPQSAHRSPLFALS